jgi:hypothetical protein
MIFHIFPSHESTGFFGRYITCLAEKVSLNKARNKERTGSTAFALTIVHSSLMCGAGCRLPRPNFL